MRQALTFFLKKIRQQEVADTKIGQKEPSLLSEKKQKTEKRNRPLFPKTEKRNRPLFPILGLEMGVDEKIRGAKKIFSRFLINFANQY
ncbi:MAG: hypothetical protein IJM66_03830 [Muribaculaceae bacterium]|nr:hypothetical protein [Muribaculaceae bacterium]